MDECCDCDFQIVVPNKYWKDLMGFPGVYYWIEMKKQFYLGNCTFTELQQKCLKLNMTDFVGV